jgi:Zn-finger nucleic acid-binding protein
MQVRCNDSQCPGELLMSERQGIEIDYCNRCRGVWLDRGELDKIIERSMRDMSPAADPSGPAAPPRTTHLPPPQPAPAYPQRPAYPKPESGDRWYGYSGSHYPSHHKSHKKKSLLKEIFDI